MFSNTEFHNCVICSPSQKWQNFYYYGTVPACVRDSELVDLPEIIFGPDCMSRKLIFQNSGICIVIVFVKINFLRIATTWAKHTLTSYLWMRVWDTGSDGNRFSMSITPGVVHQHWHLGRLKWFLELTSFVLLLQHDCRCCLFHSVASETDNGLSLGSVVTSVSTSTCALSALLFRDKSKKLAEQAAAIVCLRTLGVPEGKLCEGEDHLINKRKREDQEHLNNRNHREDLAEPSHKKANFIEETSDRNVPKTPQ